MANSELVTIAAQYGAMGIFSSLIFVLLRNQISEAREERNEWLKEIRSQDKERHEAMGKLSEVLVEIKYLLKDKRND